MTELNKGVKEVYKLLMKFASDDRRVKWLRRRKEAWDAIENEMYSADEKSEMKDEGQTPLVINKINKGVQGSSALVTDQKPEVKFHPIGSGDLYVAEILKRGHDHVWYKNQGNDTLYDLVEESKIGGLAFMYGKHNTNKTLWGRIEFEEICPTDVYFDGDSRKRDLSDTAIIIAQRRSKEYLKENYEGLTDEDVAYLPSMPGGPGTSDTWGVTGKDNYSEAEDIESSTDSKDEEEGSYPWEIEAWLLKIMYEDWMLDKDSKLVPLGVDKKQKPEEIAKQRGGEYVRRKMERRIQVLVAGSKMISQEVNPYGEDIDGDPILPIIPLKHSRTRSAFPMSPTNYALPVNKEKNKRRSQFIYLVSQNANSPIVEPANAVRWDKSPSKPGSKGEVDSSAAFQPYRLGPGTMDASRFVDLESRADSDVDDQFDMHDVMRGKIPKGTDPSGRVVLALQDMGGMMSKPYLRKVESLLESLGKLDAVLMLRHWPRLMWERLIEDDEIESQVVINEETGVTIGQRWQQALDKISPPGGEPSLSIIDLDVRVAAGSSMPTNRMAKALLAVEFKNSGIYDAKAALDYIDDPNKDEILARMKDNPNLFGGGKQ